MVKKNLRKILLDKIELLALIFFILSIFLMDVNLNNIGAYGIDIESKVFAETSIKATSLFWFGFISALVFFFIIAIRSIYKRKNKLKIADIIFGTMGILGLMITLSGGILLFWLPNTLIIPIFQYNLTRITYYHIGIALDLIALFYFTLTK